MNAVPALAVRPSRPEPLCQYELLLVANPRLQGGSHRPPKELPANGASAWLTLDIYGSVRGRVIEDMRCEVGGEDIYNLLPDAVLEEIINYVVGDI